MHVAKRAAWIRDVRHNTRLRALAICAAFLVPIVAPVAASADLAGASGYSVSTFVGGLANDGSMGPIGVVFDASGNLYVANEFDGTVSEYDSTGNLKSSVVVGGGPSGLAFSTDFQHLYVARQQANEVDEIDPASGGILRPIAGYPVVQSPTALATDPISGDLFVSQPYSTGDIVRIQIPAVGPPYPSTYVAGSSLNGYPDGMAFAPDGTLYVAEPSGFAVQRISGTNSASPGQPALPVLVGMGPDGIALIAPTTGSQVTQVVVNMNGGAILLVDLSGALFPVASGGSRGDLMTVGPDGALYATQTDRIVKVVSTGGGATFLPPLPPPTVPTSPLNVQVAPGNGFATVSWDTPNFNGGSPITSYTVTATPGGKSVTVPASQQSATIYGLTADCYATFTFTVFATNAVGNGPNSQPSARTRTSGIVSSSPPALAFILLDGAPSEERGGNYYPIPVSNPDAGVPIVSSYCPTDINGQPASFPLGLVDSIYRWDEFPVWSSSSSGISSPTTGPSCLTATGDCLPAPFAARGAVFFPYSYAGAHFIKDSTGSYREFHVEAYGNSNSAGGQPTQQIQYLQQEVASIHQVWPNTRIVIVGHSYGGLVAEAYWENFLAGAADQQGVDHLFSLDSPINGVGQSLPWPFGTPIQDWWHLLWKTRITHDAAALSADANGEFRPVGTLDDNSTYAAADFPDDGIISQIFVQTCMKNGIPGGVTCAPVIPPDYISCSAQAPIDGTVYGHDTPKVCPQTIGFIRQLVG